MENIGVTIPMLPNTGIHWHSLAFRFSVKKILEWIHALGTSCHAQESHFWPSSEDSILIYLKEKYW